VGKKFKLDLPHKREEGIPRKKKLFKEKGKGKIEKKSGKRFVRSRGLLQIGKGKGHGQGGFLSWKKKKKARKPGKSRHSLREKATQWKGFVTYGGEEVIGGGGEAKRNS